MNEVRIHDHVLRGLDLTITLFPLCHTEDLYGRNAENEYALGFDLLSSAEKNDYKMTKREEAIVRCHTQDLRYLVVDFLNFQPAHLGS